MGLVPVRGEACGCVVLGRVVVAEAGIPEGSSAIFGLPVLPGALIP